MTYDGAGPPLQRKSLGIRDLLHQPYVYLIDTFEKHVHKTAKHRHKKMKKKLDFTAHSVILIGIIILTQFQSRVRLET